MLLRLLVSILKFTVLETNFLVLRLLQFLVHSDNLVKLRLQNEILCAPLQLSLVTLPRIS